LLDTISFFVLGPMDNNLLKLHIYILAGGFVGKCFVQGEPFELADLVLIQGADAQSSRPVGLWTACAFELAEVSE
jgi:hypothetical protein